MKNFRGFYSLFIKRLNEIKTKERIIPFPSIFQKICTSFSITKEQCWEILFLLREFDFIEIIPKKGIKIRKKAAIKLEEDKLIRAENIPKVCINKCKDCQQAFEARISIKETCNACNKEFDKKVGEIEKRLREKDKDTPMKSPDWQYKLEAMIITCKERNGKDMS